MHASQALDLRVDLQSRLPDLRAQSLIAMHCAVQIDGTVTGAAYDEVSDLSRESIDGGRSLAAATVAAMSVAETFFCKAELTGLVVHASNLLDESDVWRTDQMPSESGFAYFEEALRIHDVRGRDMLCHAILWHKVTLPDGPSVVFHMFNDMEREADEVSIEILQEASDAAGRGAALKEMLAGLGRWAHIGFQFATEGSAYGPPEAVIVSPEVIEQYREAGVEVVPSTNPIRLIAAFFRLLGQTVIDRSDGDVLRMSRKRARRMGIPDRVTVIRLRRVEGRRSGESDVEWQHRWIVRGHWAWRHCSEHHPLAEPYEGGWHARVWIGAYIKGPDDAPLVVTDKVNALVR